MSEYVGALAPFYISRWRLRMLGERAVGRFGVKLSGKVAIPGVGELAFDHTRQEPATLRRLERTLAWMGSTGVIGDAWDEDRPYSWVQVNSHITRIKNNAEGVDHLVVADANAAVPAGWCVFLAGLRTNLASLNSPDKHSESGSSPLALQAVLDEVRVAGSQGTPRTMRHQGTSQRLRAACRDLSGEQPRFAIAGVVEIVYRNVKDKVLLGSPLFLSSGSAL